MIRKEVGGVARDKSMYDLKAMEWTLAFIQSFLGSH